MAAPEERRLQLLRAEIRADRGALERQHAVLTVEGSADTREVGDPHLAVAALALHHYYCAAESIFQRVAVAFEGMPRERERWHRELLRQMTLVIDDVRPAVLAPETAELLVEVLQFRHFLRHAYTTDLDPLRLGGTQRHALRGHALLSGDLDRFDAALAAAATG